MRYTTVCVIHIHNSCMWMFICFRRVGQSSHLTGHLHLRSPNTNIDLFTEYLFKLRILALCFQIGTIARQIGHVLGLWQEHLRPDRGSHIVIHGNNSQLEHRGNLEVEIPAKLINTFGFPYDYASLMHYHGKVCTFVYN